VLAGLRNSTLCAATGARRHTLTPQRSSAKCKPPEEFDEDQSVHIDFGMKTDQNWRPSAPNPFGFTSLCFTLL
jgi:hypothetical protein